MDYVQDNHKTIRLDQIEQFAQVRLSHDDIHNAQCSICISAFKKDDTILILPCVVGVFSLLMTFHFKKKNRNSKNSKFYSYSTSSIESALFAGYWSTVRVRLVVEPFSMTSTIDLLTTILSEILN